MYLDQQQTLTVREWWSALQPEAAPNRRFWMLGRADRARLRRCSDLDQLLLEPAVLVLVEQLWPDAKPEQYRALALLAGVLAQLKSDSADQRSLAFKLGKAVVAVKDMPPKLSELRFQRLLHTQLEDELYRQLVRAVQLADAQADINTLINDVLAWCTELRGSAGLAHKSIRFKWARDYYLSAKDQRSAEQ